MTAEHRTSQCGIRVDDQDGITSALATKGVTNMPVVIPQEISEMRSDT
jgi:hypothetical protein